VLVELVRRNYSPISFKISLFEPNPARNMDNEAVDREIERLRAQQAGQNGTANYENAGHPVESTNNIQGIS